MRILHYLTCIWLLLLGVFNLQAQTQYIGPNNGDWFNDANWNNGIPATGNDALVGGGVTVVVGSPLTVNFGITAFGNISASAAVTVDVGGSIANSGTMAIAATGSLTNNATVQNFGTLTFAGAAGFTNGTGANFTNSGSLALQAILANQGTITNNGSLDALNGSVQTSGTFNNNQTLTTKSLTIDAGSTFTNNFGAILNVTGASGLFQVNGNVTNNGIVNATGIMTVNGNFNNNVTLKVAVATVLTINAGGQMTNAGTLDNSGFLQNNGNFTNGQNLLNKGEVNNFSVFNNNNLVENQSGANFFNRPAGTLGMGFGSKILNLGSFTNLSAINSFGTIENNGSFTNSGTLLSFGGSLIDNNSNFTNNNTISTNDVVVNDGAFTNAGIVNVNGGSVWSNNANFTNSTSGTVNVVQDFVNKTTGMLTNNGTFRNAVRTRNEGSFTNNAYLHNPGDFTNAAGATLTNNELILLQAGNLLNAGSIENTDKILVDECSSVRNTGTLNNTGGNLELHGIFFQKGTTTGTAVNNQGGYIHTGATSAAPSVCQNGTFGADVNGNIKVYAGSLVSFSNFDSCANIIYLANDVDRPVFHCTDIGVLQNLNLIVRTRLGDELTCVAQVTPVDALAPQIADCPKDQVIFTPNTTAVATWSIPTATDNCSAVTSTTTHTPGSIFPVGITGVTYTFKDIYNNENQCQFRIDVRQTAPGSNCEGDSAGPVFTGCPSNISTPKLADLTPVSWTPPTPSDNCNPINLTFTHIPGQVFPTGTTTVTYTASDGNDNSSTCAFTITVTSTDPCLVDTQKPTIFGCPANLLLPTNPAIDGAVASWNAPGAVDNCGVTSLSGTHLPGAVFPVGTTTVTYTATDAANNSATCGFTITVGPDPCPGDVTAPLITGCPANISLLTAGASATATWTAPTATDACAQVTLNSTHAPGSVFHLGVTQVTYQFSDKKGNESACNFTVTVQNACSVDNVKPVIAGCPASVTVPVGTNGLATVSWTPPTATDNCGLSSFSSAYLPGTSFPVGTTTVVYSALDLKGNAATCQFNVTVYPPPSCTTNAAPINGTTGVNPATVTVSWNAASGASSYNVYLGTTNPPTTMVATNVIGTSKTLSNLAIATHYWYVVPTNLAGSATGCQSSVTSFTTQPPCSNVTNAGTISGNQTICSGNDPAAFTNTTLPSGGAGTLEYVWQQTTLDPGSNPNTWTTIVGATGSTFDPPVLAQGTWYRRGARRGNCADYLFTLPLKVTVIATPEPQISLAQPSCSILSGGVLITNLPAGHYSKLDNGSQNLNQATYTNLLPGLHTITIGSNGCDKSATFTINALPTAPIAVCQNITIQLTPASSNVVVVAATEINNGSTGGCAPLSFTVNGQNSLSLTCANLGANTVTLQATDAAWRSSTCSATITVQDATPPSLVCKNITVQLGSTGQVSITPIQVLQSATDNCSGTVNLVSVVPNAFSCPNIGTYTVLLTANDGKGNNSTCSATVTVKDESPPQVICKNATVQLNSNGQASITPASVFLSGTDNCGTVNLVTVFPAAFSCANMGANTVMLTANDGKGNTATCTATVTIGQDVNSILTFTILARDEVHMRENTVNGNIGVWGAGKESKIHKESIVNGFVRSPLIDLKDGSIISGAQLLMQSPAPAPATFKYNTLPEPPSNIMVPDNYVGVFMLNGTNFKKIEVGKNSTVKFTATGIIYIKEFKTKDSDSGKHSTVLFSGNTELVVRRKIELGKRTELNWSSAYQVKFYIEEDNSLIKESCKVNASIDIRFKDLKVDNAKEQNHTLLNGQFIAKKVDANKWVDWSWSPFECGSMPLPPGVTTTPGDNFGLVEGREKDAAFGTDNLGEMTVYPNPTSGSIYVNLANINSKDAFIRLIDINGKSLKEWEITASEDPVELQLDGLRSGQYLLWIGAEGKAPVSKRITVVTTK